MNRVPPLPIRQAPLMLPYQVAEAPRLLLHVLTKSSMLDANIGHFITNWLIGYDECLRDFITTNYGPRMVSVADAITSEVSANMISAFADEYERSTAEAFALWTQQLEDDGDVDHAS